VHLSSAEEANPPGVNSREKRGQRTVRQRSMKSLETGKKIRREKKGDLRETSINGITE